MSMILVPSPKLELEFEFDEAEHRYSVSGVAVPSVSSIIRGVGLVDYDGIDQRVVARKAVIGTEVHRACEFHDNGCLDPDSLDPVVSPYYRAYCAFLKDSGFTPTLVEKRMVVEVNGMRYGMTLDRLGTLGADSAIVDMKCTAAKSDSWKVQTAGYALGVRKNLGVSAKRFALHLKPDEKYKLYEYKDSLDEQAFMWALGLAYYKLRG